MLPLEAVYREFIQTERLSRWADSVLCGEQRRAVPPGGILRGQKPERRESSGFTYRAAHEV
jgi:hypothetical protein